MLLAGAGIAATAAICAITSCSSRRSISSLLAHHHDNCREACGRQHHPESCAITPLAAEAATISATATATTAAAAAGQVGSGRRLFCAGTSSSKPEPAEPRVPPIPNCMWAQDLLQLWAYRPACVECQLR